MTRERAHPHVALPLVAHHVASDVPSSTRVLVIGDVHGCYDELQSLLEACDYSPRHDRLAFVGDLVNKGPKSLEALRFVQDSGALCVRGNHEDAALSAYYAWLQAGARPNTAKYSYVEQLEARDVAFLQQLPFSLALPNHGDVLVVHAGVVPDVELEDQRLVDLYKMRYVQWGPAEDGQGKTWVALEKDKWKNDEAGAVEKWATVWKGPRHVYFGHAATIGLQQEKFATGLDTGCCYGRQLTACILPSNELVQVDAKKQYEVPGGDKK
ncbi:unnamed protein product [Hyaloperonospora brassicae]|uniref:Serine/threonine specific protein phosphatases domain-containing protein n=1 Tax=Hyaloperonospora brassicae TaxID=162125 RepID=A0AAV0ULS4_HYABA|nr:unnamed protein product [Hyaloperonospora brassicae]